MKVKVFPLDVWGCGHYRMFWPSIAVAEQTGVDASVVAPDERKVAIKLDPWGRVAGEGFPAEAGDVVVLQRPTPLFMPAVMQRLQDRGVAVVVDMDDDLSSIHPKNATWLQYHPKSQNGHSWHAAQECCRMADLVTVTTPQLARRYGGHGRVRILPNMIPERYLEIEHTDSATMGWAGSVSTHPDDLQQLGPSIANMVRAGFRFETVGDIREVARVLGLPDDPPSPGAVPFAEYPRALARFGIGLAPLAPTRFNEAKSRLKPLEYASVGVPWVGSATEDYRAFHGEGCGVIVENPRRWEKILRSLARDEARRVELSEAGREVARRNTMERNAWRWAEAWGDAAAQRRLLQSRPLAPG